MLTKFVFLSSALSAVMSFVYATNGTFMNVNITDTSLNTTQSTLLSSSQPYPFTSHDLVITTNVPNIDTSLQIETSTIPITIKETSKATETTTTITTLRKDNVYNNSDNIIHKDDVEASTTADNDEEDDFSNETSNRENTETFSTTSDLNADAAITMTSFKSNLSKETSNSTINDKLIRNDDINDESTTELNEMKKTKTILNSKRKVHDKNDDNDEVEENEEDEEEDEEEEENAIAENICTAEYFIDRIVPEDYPSPVEKNVKHINETIERINRLYRFSEKILQNFNPLIREMGSRIMDFFYEAQIEPQCLGAFVRIIRGIQQRKQWAVSFIDATGSVVTGGFQEGRFVSFGEFEQCIAIESKSDDEMIAGEPIRGQYCMVKPVIPLPDSIVHGENIVKPEVEIMNRVLSDQYIETYLGLFRYMKNTILKLGLCLPLNCKPQEIENALNKFFVRKSGLSIQIGPRCVSANEPIEIDSYQAISILIFSIIGMLIIASTIYELTHRLINHVKQDHVGCMQIPLTHTMSKRISTPTSFSEPKSIFSTVQFQRQTSTMSSVYEEKPLKLQIFTIFSLIRNTRVLFDTPPSTRKASIDTIRLLLILFFFVSNAYIYTIIFAPMVLKRFYVIGPLQLLNDKKYFFIRMYYMIHCFVTLSGITMVLNYRSQRFQYCRFVIITYIRYVAPILFTIGAIYVIPLLNSGPMWSQFNDTITESCRHSLWQTVLFYNNFNYNVETVCNFPTVIVSLIFQLKLIAPLIIAFLSRLSTRKMFFVLALLLSATMSLNLFLRFYFHIRIPHEYSQMKSFSEIKHSVMYFNFNPLIYLATLIFGIGVGFIIKYQIKFRHLHVMAFGFLSFATFIIGVIYMESLELHGREMNIITLITIISWGRIPMLAFISWIVYASEERHILMTKRFLSSVVWYPLCQLSYGFYISSLIVNGYRLFSIEENITLAPQVMFRAIVSDAVIAFLFSYLIHVFVVQPMKNVRYVLLEFPFKIFRINIKNSDISSQSSPVECSNESPKMFRIKNESKNKKLQFSQSIENGFCQIKLSSKDQIEINHDEIDMKNNNVNQTEDCQL